jgi:hypothetical protein
VFAVGTDGDLPATLSSGTRRLFLDTIKRLSERLLKDVARGLSQPDNQLLRCLTWINGLCPAALKDEVLTAMRCIGTGNAHPLLAPRAAKRVLLHRLGRVTAEPATLYGLIPALCGRLDQADCLGAFSSLISRPADTPRVLAKLDVAAIAQHLIKVLYDLRDADSYGVNLKYALLCVGGLLRVRENEPWALVADRSPPAKALVEVRTFPFRVPSSQAKLNSARELIHLLSGTGGRPDILTFMDDIPDN